MADRDPFPALLEEDVDPDPIVQFERWFEAARASGIQLPETMLLATATRDGVPSARAVLLKGIEDGGFVFFTNYESRKARDLDENPRAALTFLWGPLGRQVRVEGGVERVPRDASEAYFRTRPLGSRLGAWASPQSAVIEDRGQLESGVAGAAARFGDEIPLPPFWGGYRVVPDALEFWQHRSDRLHDRLRYRRIEGGWSLERLAP